MSPKKRSTLKEDLQVIILINKANATRKKKAKTRDFWLIACAANHKATMTRIRVNRTSRDILINRFSGWN